MTVIDAEMGHESLAPISYSCCLGYSALSAHLAW